MLARACLLAQEEESLKEMLEEEKRQYKEGFAQLKALKSEIEHLQHLLEQSRRRLQAPGPLPNHNPNPAAALLSTLTPAPTLT